MIYDFEELNALVQQVLEIAREKLDPEPLLTEIVARIGEAFEGDRCFIVATPARGVRALFGLWPVAASAFLTPEVKTRVLAATARAGNEPLAIADLQAETAEFAQLAELLSVRAWLSEPLGEPNSTRGWIAIANLQPRTWSDEEQQGLKHLSAALSLICDRAEFQQQVRAYQRYQAPVSRLSEVLYAASEDEPDLQSALAETALALQVDRAWLMTLKYADPLQKNRRPEKIPKAKATAIARWPQVEAEGEDLTFALAACSLCARTWQQAPESLAIDNLDTFDPLKPLSLPPFLTREPMQAWLFVPLSRRTGNEVANVLPVGFLLFQGRFPRVWQPEELDLACWVGEQLSAAMLQNQTQRQVQALVEERTAQLRWSGELQAKLSEKMRVQIDELKRANQIKDEFLATVQDELKHPLAKMKMAIEMLKIAPDSQRRQLYLDILETECAKETKLIVDILTLQQLRSQQFNSDRQHLNLPEILAGVARTFEERWADKGLTLEIDNRLADPDDPSPKPLTLFADANSFNRILLELLTNAGKFARAQTRVTLTAASQTDSSGRQIVLAVANTGPGISPEEQEAIFDPFTQIGRKGSEQGTGLGLALVRELVKHLNGAIEVSSVPIDESNHLTSFTLTLPQAGPEARFWEPD